MSLIDSMTVALRPISVHREVVQFPIRSSILRQAQKPGVSASLAKGPDLERSEM